MKIPCDLHIHSALSPCGEERMTPNNIVNMALVAGLELIALTDHNTCGNCRAVMEAGNRAGLAVIPGMELTTAEDAHVVCLFPSADDAEAFEDEVAPRRMPIPNKPEVFGRQLRMDADDKIVGEAENLLIPATTIDAYEVQGLCRAHNGVAIPAHIDKDSNSLLASLGYLDPDLGFPICEITPHCDADTLVREHSELKDVMFLRDSDAHDLPLIGTNGQTLDLPGTGAAEAVQYLYNIINGGHR